jgi:group I intron endonuclease
VRINLGNQLQLCGVYAIINSRTFKLYVGSSTNVQRRIKIHFRDLRFNRHHSIHLQRAYNLEPSMFGCELIEICQLQELRQREQFWIDFYRAASWLNGYNACKKSDSRLDLPHTPKSRAKISAAQKANPSWQRPVLQFDLAGKFIARHRTILEAEVAVSNKRCGVADACNGRITHAKGFQWRYAETVAQPELGITPKPDRKQRGNPVQQYSLDGALIGEYASYREAERQSGIKEGTLRLASKRVSNPYTGGFRWQSI